MGDVQDAQNAVDHGETQGNEGVYTTDCQTVGELLPNHFLVPSPQLVYSKRHSPGLNSDFTDAAMSGLYHKGPGLFSGPSLEAITLPVV